LICLIETDYSGGIKRISVPEAKATVLQRVMPKIRQHTFAGDTITVRFRYNLQAHPKAKKLVATTL
jgi:hypothetical protein